MFSGRVHGTGNKTEDGNKSSAPPKPKTQTEITTDELSEVYRKISVPIYCNGDYVGSGNLNNENAKKFATATIKYFTDKGLINLQNGNKE